MIADTRYDKFTAMSGNKTKSTGADVRAYLDALAPKSRRDDARALDDIFQDVTGFSPQMWGDSIVGYGRYHYRYASGREGDFLATGFAPRSRNFSVYIMPGYADFKSILARLGKHKTGKACLHFNRLSDIDTAVLRELILAGLQDLESRWAIEPR